MRNLKNLLVYRFIIFNVLIVSVLTGIEFNSGLLSGFFINDATFITAATLALFVIAFGCTIKNVWLTNRKLKEDVSLGEGEYRIEQIAYLEKCAVWMAALGLIGTVVGFSFALSDTGAESFGTLEGVKEFGATVLAGMHIAFNTTIVGAGLGLWTEMNYQMLRTQVALIASVEERAWSAVTSNQEA